MTHTTESHSHHPSHRTLTSTPKTTNWSTVNPFVFDTTVSALCSALAICSAQCRPSSSRSPFRTAWPRACARAPCAACPAAMRRWRCTGWRTATRCRRSWVRTLRRSISTRLCSVFRHCRRRTRATTRASHRIRPLRSSSPPSCRSKVCAVSVSCLTRIHL